MKSTVEIIAKMPVTKRKIIAIVLMISSWFAIPTKIAIIKNITAKIRKIIAKVNRNLIFLEIFSVK